ncbi:LPS-assembly protein LptD [Amphritea balenae]|uniref:LPS-assembly protein LptD n=1 Tax=Amphritea balenae TaxID=452629 RepID=A0A3P1SSK3_9GAMM|nr:LPS-assembly protein LptD [Amphritea balenae]RRC99162.1 LPS-assembly protein LptD [Amphritea balenae]GGK73413.1 LPS-assembly protein LptD [Amphritea balenae]
MPFSRRSSYTLTLAVIAALSNSTQAAETAPVAKHALWTCTMQQGQNWDCDNQKQAAAEDQASVTEDSNTGSDNSDKFENTTKTTAATITEQNINGRWQCDAGTNGSWNCTDTLNLGTPTTPVEITKSGIPASQNKIKPQQATISSQPTLNIPAADLTITDYAQQDWYPISGASKACHGVYIEPDYQTTSDAETGKLRIDADQSDTQLGGLTQLKGNVELRQSGHYLRSDSAEVDQVSNQIRLTGNIRYREPGLLLLGSEAQTNALSGETVVSNANYVVHEQSLRGKAKRIIRLQDDRVRMEQSTYTTCAPSDESWKIAADSLVLDPNRGFGTAKHATLKVADIPVFYFPYLEFPIDDQRHSGFLFPSIGYSKSDGLELGIPYYFNLAANYDDTLTPRLFTERGLLLENEFRHMDSYGQQSLSTGLLFNDNKFNKDRWLLGVDHLGGSGSWSSEIDFNAVSDSDYFDDLGSSLEVDRTTHLDRLAKARFQQQNWNATLRVHDYQTIDSSKSPYQRLPQLQVRGQYNIVKGQEFAFKYLTDATQFDRDTEGLTGIDRVTGSRLHVQPSASMPIISSWGYLKPEISYWMTQYNLNDQISGQDDSISRTATVFSMDSGLYFERETDNYTQSLEPRLFALYSSKEEQQGIPDFDTSLADFSYKSLFRSNRFFGLDKIGDSQQVSLGLSSAFYRADGSELSRFSLGQAFYFADRTVQLNGITTVDTDEQSNFAAQASWNPFRDLRVTLDTELDRDNVNLVATNAKIHYTPSINKTISFGYRQRDGLRNQTDLSFIWPLAPEWSMMGRWQEDLENKQTPEALLGVEYASCCWKVRLAARQWIEDDSIGQKDSAIYLQFVLKGLGEVGNGDSALKDIIGFKEREENNDY